MKNISKKILIIGAIIVGLIIVISVASMLRAKSNQVKLGKTVTIKEENIEITVLSSEKTTIEDPYGILVEVGDFVKVKVRIKNNGSSPYTWNNLMSFRMGDKYVAMSEHGDDLPNTIDAGEVVEGYLYFEYTDETVMNYYTSFNVVDSNTASMKEYLFKIN